MPLFEFQCRDCGDRFETVVFDRARQVTCRSCHGTHLQKLVSVFAVAGGARTEMASAEPGPCTTCGASQRGVCSMSE